MVIRLECPTFCHVVGTLRYPQWVHLFSLPLWKSSSHFFTVCPAIPFLLRFIDWVKPISRETAKHPWAVCIWEAILVPVQVAALYFLREIILYFCNSLLQYLSISGILCSGSQWAGVLGIIFTSWYKWESSNNESFSFYCQLHQLASATYISSRSVSFIHCRVLPINKNLYLALKFLTVPDDRHKVKKELQLLKGVWVSLFLLAESFSTFRVYKVNLFLAAFPHLRAFWGLPNDCRRWSTPLLQIYN